MEAPSSGTSTVVPLGQALLRAPSGTGPPQTPAVIPEELFCFRSGSLYLAIPSRYVREVIRLGPITPLPRVAPFVLGVLGHRGEVLPVVDLLRLLDRGKAALTDRTRLFVGVFETLTVAWICDGTFGLRRIEPSELKPAPLGGGAAMVQLTAFVFGTADEPPLHVLNFARLFQLAREKAVAR